MPQATHDLVARALPGAMDHGDGLVTFAIYAPGKDSVHLIGDFNGWDAEADLLDQRDAGYWVIAKQLRSGRTAYQFVLDSDQVVCDPYAQDTTPFPDEQSKSPQAVIEVGRAPYRWKHADWRPPPLSDLILYELHVGDFSPEGTFQGVANRLDHLQSLGINAIEFMPLTQGGRQDYWGYAPNYFLAVRRDFGTLQDLLELVDECHGRGIACIMDIVLTHTGQGHPFMRMYDYDESPWYGDSLGEENQFGMPMLDYTKDATNAFVRDVQAYWLNVVHLDGFRYDYVAGLGADDEGHGIGYLTRTAREFAPGAYLIGECIPEQPEIINNRDLSAAWHARWRRALNALIRERHEADYDWQAFSKAVGTFDPADQGYQDASMMVNYVECHDDERCVQALEAMGFESRLARRKSALAATILMTLPGEPMLYQGQEWGENTEKSQQANKIHWEQLDNEAGRGLCKHFRRLGELRRSQAAIRSSNFQFARVDEEHKTLVYHRWREDAPDVVVAVNFANLPQDVECPFPGAGRWREFFTGGEVQVDTKPVTQRVEGYASAIFIRE